MSLFTKDENVTNIHRMKKSQDSYIGFNPFLNIVRLNCSIRILV